MIFALIGHRGVGKSALLTRIAAYYRDAGRAVTTVDLDREIEARSQQSIAAIFAAAGEAHFRELEQTTLIDILAALRKDRCDADAYIAIGAGFSEALPDDVHAVWIRRDTDPLGRIFVDRQRPRLSAAASPLDEYLDRFARREQRYRQLHHDVLCIREGVEGSAAPDVASTPAHDVERAFVLSALATAPISPAQPIGGVLSLLPEDLRKGEDWLTRRLAWPALRFELRDDLFDDRELAQAMTDLPASRRILSFRRAGRSTAARQEQASREALWDFPLELGHQQTPQAPPILSLHERREGEPFADAAARLEQAGAQMSAQLLKLAVEVRDFAELLAGWRWAQSDPAHRVFLPRALANQPGRWRWFRLLSGFFAPLAFFREAEGTSLDQPLLVEWWQLAALGGGNGRFAAVLGDPILHSRTPVEHAPFFAQRDMPVLAIAMRQDEVAQGGLEVLRELGLRYAAVTAPLKHAVAAQLHAKLELPLEIESVNTLYYSEAARRFYAQNTDFAGAAALLAPLATEPNVAVWGGGGTLPVLRATLPQARYFSSRTGQSRELQGDGAWQPEAVVWASGSARHGGFPDPRWNPKTVYDLSYGEDSAGREYALRTGARYVSGLTMFFAQAAAQRDFFASAEKNFEELGP